MEEHRSDTILMAKAPKGSPEDRPDPEGMTLTSAAIGFPAGRQAYIEHKKSRKNSLFQNPLPTFHNTTEEEGGEDHDTTQEDVEQPSWAQEQEQEGGNTSRYRTASRTELYNNDTAPTYYNT